MRHLAFDLREAPKDTAEAAVYVAELSAALAEIARRHGFDTLGYILDMAQEEARHNAGNVRRSDPLLSR